MGPKQAICDERCISQKNTCAMQCIFTAICVLALRSCRPGTEPHKALNPGNTKRLRKKDIIPTPGLAQKILQNFGGDPTCWVHFIQKCHFFPSFIVKYGQEKPPQVCGGFSCFQVFSSFFFLPEGAWAMTDHIGTNASKFVPPRWGRPLFDPTQTGLCKFGRGFGAR